MVDATSPHPVKLQRGEAVPHFRVITVRGRTVDYSTIWQRLNLVLVALSESDSAASSAYVLQLEAGSSTFHSQETACVITTDVVAGVTSPAVVIADRWGEIVHVATTASSADLPRLEEILDWVAYLQTRCPECEGETR